MIATHNAGKLREMSELLSPYGVDAVGAGALGLPEPEETGDSFEANAALKAEAATRATGWPALADDSGLCVDGLNGAPGIFSARFAREAGSFAGALEAIRRLLGGAAQPYRAHFISVLALARPGEATVTVEGRVDGDLVFPPRGDAGFGYDPAFRPDGLERTFGEMTADEKHGIPADGSPALSHRARAFQRFARDHLRACPRGGGA